MFELKKKFLDLFISVNKKLIKWKKKYVKKGNREKKIERFVE